MADVNNSAYGLHIGVFTRDLRKAFYAYENIEAGGVEEKFPEPHFQKFNAKMMKIILFCQNFVSILFFPHAKFKKIVLGFD